jgi:hypothetical protein
VFSSALWAPNARGEPRPEAEARHERKLEAVGSSARLGEKSQCQQDVRANGSVGLSLWGATRTLAVVCLSLRHILTPVGGALGLPLPRRGRPDCPILPVVAPAGLLSLAYGGYPGSAP